MKIDVYDSYAKFEGRMMHFDVFVKEGISGSSALQYGRQWLSSIGESAEGLEQALCNFCHSEMANPEVAKSIESNGYFILQMEGCPAPY